VGGAHGYGGRSATGSSRTRDAAPDRHSQATSSARASIAVEALAEGITTAHSINSDKVSHAMAGMTIDTPVGERTFSVKSHETFSPEFWGVMVEEAAYPFAIMRHPELLPKAFPVTN
jgi:hypothetical protein